MKPYFSDYDRAMLEVLQLKQDYVDRIDPFFLRHLS